MSDPILFRPLNVAKPVPFVKTFVASEQFRILFRQGMGLVEETAVYLDGAGREQSKALPRDAALNYATESMRLTTRLMQIASWLLVQRAVAEGELTSEQARNEKNRVKIGEAGSPADSEVFLQMPERLRELVELSIRMQARIRLLESQVNGESDIQDVVNPVAGQIARLQDLFAR
jgi:regulator of CtrA degradation